MVNKKLTVPNGSRVTIEIGADENRRRLVPYTPKGILKQRKPSEYWPRRLKKGGLRFFDLGRLTNGDDIDFLIQPDFIQTDMGTDVPVPIPELSDFAARDAFLFALTEDNNFEQVFFEVKQPDGDLYNLTIGTNEEFTEYEILRTDSDLWKPGGVGITKPPILKWIYVSNDDGTASNDFRADLFNAIFFGLISDATYIKVTQIYDFDAEEIENFELNSSDLVFLLPALAVVTGYAAFGLDDFARERFLNYDFRFGMRSYYVPDQHPAINPAAAFSNQFSDPATYENTYAAAQIHAAFTGARCFERRYTDEEAETTTWTTIPDPFDITPDPPFTPTSIDSNPYNLEFVFANFGDVPGTLLAIVKRGNNLFYLWKI